MYYSVKYETKTDIFEKANNHHSKAETQNSDRKPEQP